MKITFPLLICVLLGQLPASAQTVHYITNLFDSGAGSFRSEVGLALPGDTIRFQVTGTITLINGAIVYDKDLVIDGPGMDQLTISGGGQSGVLIVQGHSSWISGLSLVDGQITGNLSNGGAGLFFTGDTLVLDSVRIADCTNSSGGGTIYGGGARIEALRVRMTDCVVENNLLHSAGGSGIAVGPQGGGAYIVADSVRMVHSAFLLNRCWQTNSFAGSVIAEGGGFTLDGAAQLIGCTIDGNTVEARCYYDPVYFAVSTGGGIDAEHNSYLELIDCSVSHNTLVAR
ncbi:MAG: hypothetical protein IT229_01360, partial [Flavobacteriales bacterium]|nr:hypothetical protein [Flavobacteriales bacterium]